MRNTFLLLLFILTSCQDKKLIKYDYKDSEIELNWYYHSYITSWSPDFVEVKCGESFQKIFVGKNILSEVLVKDKKITILHNGFSKDEDVFMRTESICGYEISYIELTEEQRARRSHERYLEYQKEQNKK